MALKRGIGISLVLAGCLLTMPLHGQQGNSGAAPGKGKQPEQQPKQQDANPFPTDTTDVPVLPSRENPAPETPANTPTSSMDQIEDTSYPVPGDSDPVMSPDEASGEMNTGGGVSSSNANSLDSILPPSGGDEDSRKKGKKGSSDVLEGMPKESAAQDISVAKYYLDNKNWRAALSRYESALVLAPEDPEVYWGLAVSQQHMGDFSNARANYEKVIEYDPDSKHAKEAKKALKEPELANAKPAKVGQNPQ